MVRKIGLVTGSRAEYGLLRPVIAALKADPEFDVGLIVSAMHLSPEFGMTVREIEADGHRIDARVEMLVSSDTGVGVAKSIGLGTIGFADAFARASPDVVLLFGDRFETLAAAQAALVMRIPAAHISGGHVTHGAFDDAIRHSITKMSHIHFATTADAGQRIRQLGEAEASIHVVGDPGLDAIRLTARFDRAEVERRLGLRFRARNLLVTYHPVTLDPVPSIEQFDRLLAALDELGTDVGIVLTRPNADVEGRALAARAERFASARPNVVAHSSLGTVLYLSTMAAVDVVVGNSSSGLLEAPSLERPSVNIGIRQSGRPKAESVIDSPVDTAAIVAAIRRAFALDARGVKNPYGDGHAADRIAAVLRRISDPRSLLLKRFQDLAAGPGDLQA